MIGSFLFIAAMNCDRVIKVMRGISRSVSDWSIQDWSLIGQKSTKIDKSGSMNSGGNNTRQSSCTEIFIRSIPKILVWIIAISISGPSYYRNHES